MLNPKKKITKIAVASFLVWGSVQVTAGAYHLVKDFSLNDRPFLLTCESGALMWGQGGGFNLSEARRRMNAAMPQNAGDVQFPPGTVGETKGRIGEHIISSNQFEVTYSSSRGKMDNNGEYPDVGLTGKGTTTHYYLDEDRVLHPVSFSLAKNYIAPRGTSRSKGVPVSKQVARIIGVAPADAEYAVFHRQLTLNDGVSFEGWWAVPLTHEFRYQPTEGGFMPDDAIVWGPSPNVYQEYGQKLVECDALVHQTKSFYSLFQKHEKGSTSLTPKPFSVASDNFYGGEVFIGTSKDSLDSLPGNPRSLYDDFY